MGGQRGPATASTRDAARVAVAVAGCSDSVRVCHGCFGSLRARIEGPARAAVRRQQLLPRFTHPDFQAQLLAPAVVQLDLFGGTRAAGPAGHGAGDAAGDMGLLPDCDGDALLEDGEEGDDGDDDRDDGDDDEGALDQTEDDVDRMLRELREEARAQHDTQAQLRQQAQQEQKGAGTEGRARAAAAAAAAQKGAGRDRDALRDGPVVCLVPSHPGSGQHISSLTRRPVRAASARTRLRRS